LIKIFNQEESESEKQESRKGISEIEGKAARVATEFQSRNAGRESRKEFSEIEGFEARKP